MSDDDKGPFTFEVYAGHGEAAISRAGEGSDLVNVYPVPFDAEAAKAGHKVASEVEVQAIYNRIAFACQLTDEDIALLKEALDSHRYWQVGESHQRNDGDVSWEPDDENAAELQACDDLEATFAVFTQTPAPLAS